MSPTGPESRFQPAGLGSAHIAPNGDGTDGLHTGRHWWGRLADDFVEPVTGEEADELAEALGLSAMRGDETGTTVCVVDPFLAGTSLDDTMSFVVAAMVWNFWPKMIPDAHRRIPISFIASCEGVRIPVPDPQRYPPLEGFVAALEALDRGDVVDDGVAIVSDIRQQRPRRTLGRLSVGKFATQARMGVGATVPPAPFEGPAHHVALMRPVRLVVRYHEGPRLPIDAVQYGGVFIADPALDDVFKSSEPPTHDDWRDTFLQSWTDRSVLHVTDREIRAALDQLSAPPGGSQAGEAGGPVGGLAIQLAGLLPGLGGPGAEAREREKDGEARPRRPRARVRIVGSRAPILLDGRPAIEVSCQVVHVPGTEGTMIAATAHVALDEGALETDPPLDAAAPSVKFWIAPDGRRFDGDRVWVGSGDVGVWQVTVAAVPDLMVAVDIEPVSA